MSKNQRLKAARIRAGFKTAAEAARRMRVPYGTYSGHESGARGIKEEELKLYAETFGVSLGWLAYDEANSDRKPNQNYSLSTVSGTVGDKPNGIVTWIHAHILSSQKLTDAAVDLDTGRFVDEIPVPNFESVAPAIVVCGKNLSALIVNGNSIRSIAQNGDVLYFDRADGRDDLRSDLGPSICLGADDNFYVGSIYRIKGSDTAYVRLDTASDRGHVAIRSAWPIMLIMTRIGRTTALRSFADHLMKAADEAAARL